MCQLYLYIYMYKYVQYALPFFFSIINTLSYNKICMSYYARAGVLLAVLVFNILSIIAA